MSCKGSMIYFKVGSVTCKTCNDYEECRNKVADSLSKIGMKRKAGIILKRRVEPTKRQIPEVGDDIPTVVKEKIRALYRRGFSYHAGQKENPFGMDDPITLSLIYNELFKKERLSKREIRQAIVDELGWGDQSAKVEVSRIIHVMVFIGIASLKNGMLVFQNDNSN